MRVDGAVVALVLDAPDAVEELHAGERSVGVPRQEEEQVELAHGEVNGLAAACHLAADRVDGEVVKDERRLFFRVVTRPRELLFDRTKTPECRAHARHDLLQ